MIKDINRNNFAILGGSSDEAGVIIDAKIMLVPYNCGTRVLRLAGFYTTFHGGGRKFKPSPRRGKYEVS